MFLLVVYGLVGVSVCLYCILYNLVKVRIGSPPIGFSLVGYKYSSSSKARDLKSISRAKFPTTRKFLKIFYSSPNKDGVEFAEGLVLGEEEDSGGAPLSAKSVELLQEVSRLGLSLFSLPQISHAVFVQFPVCFSLTLSKLFAVLLCYPRINHVLKSQNLCGYPLLEVYSKESIAIVVPLMRQDHFIVPEAEDFVFGKSFYETFGHSFERRIRSRSSLLSKHFSLLSSIRFLSTSKDMKSSKSHKRIMKG